MEVVSPGRAGVEVVPLIYVPGEYCPRELSKTGLPLTPLLVENYPNPCNLVYKTETSGTFGGIH